MKIIIHGVADSRDHNRERLILNVIENTDIGEYLVLDTTYLQNGNVSNKARHVHWFLDQEVKKGDLIVLYTKPGTSSIEKKSDGTTIYFYYWGLNNSAWNNDKDCAVLIHYDEWIHKAVK